jgi:hypothetical protein
MLSARPRVANTLDGWSPKDDFMSIRSIVFLSILTAGTMLANSVTLNFASLSQAGSGMAGQGSTVSVDGFKFTSGDSAFDVWQSSNVNLPSLLASDTSLFEFFAGSTTTVTDGGSAFSLDSIDLAPVLAGGNGSFTVSFTGTHPDSSTVTQMFTVNDSNPATLQTFDFSGFTDLVNVKFSQGINFGLFGSQDTAYQFDNLIVTTPEPRLLLPLMIALICLVAFARFKLPVLPALEKTAKH